MESSNKLREIDIKSLTYHYFDGIINTFDFDLDDIFWMKNRMKIF